MNKVILMGRITRDPEVKYSQSAEPIAIGRYSLAVSRRFKRDGDQDTDFINIVAFGKAGEFAGQYFKKGMQVIVSGRLQTGSYDDKDGNKRYTTDVIAEEQEFAESKRVFEERMKTSNSTSSSNESKETQSGKTSLQPTEADFDDDDDLPF